MMCISHENDFPEIRKKEVCNMYVISMNMRNDMLDSNSMPFSKIIKGNYLIL